MTDPMPGQGLAPANDADARPEDIRDQLRRDHDVALAELDALLAERDDARAMGRLRQLRRNWVVHALAEESVVYRVLEGVEIDAGGRADERFIEHELVEGLFDKLSRARPRSMEWKARLRVARELMRRHIESEHEELFVRLSERLSQAELFAMRERFVSARDKLLMLEEAKAA